MVTTDHDIAAPPSSGTSLADSLAAFAWKAASILHDSHTLNGQAGTQAAGAASGFGGVARFVAWIAAAFGEELRIRRDMRQLRAMDESMLKDIGLTRADVGTAVRYGRD